jgi:6-pyruvoyl-tetrahydropterin synthase
VSGYDIVERYSFAATHKVFRGIRCGPVPAVHLHRWRIELLLTLARLPDPDRPCELTGLEPLRRYVFGELDGKYLNTVLPAPSTPMRLAEHLTRWCVANLTEQVAAALRSVTVSIATDGADGLLASRVLTGGDSDNSWLAST